MVLAARFGTISNQIVPEVTFTLRLRVGHYVYASLVQNHRCDYCCCNSCAAVYLLLV
jgi:hypothetical protein